VFISSTYYDLKHVRSSLQSFVESLGFDCILSEKGDIPYAHDQPLDESCYREVETADIFVLVVGGRYGSGASGSGKKPSHEFFETYESVTKKEYKAAVEKDIPIFVMIEKAIYAEYETFLRNADRTDVQYAHVDSANVFRLIREILAQSRNNPVYPFDGHKDIAEWLREQWAGLFRELLSRRSQQAQLSSLAGQVTRLEEVTATLKTYLEELMTKVDPAKAGELIKQESERLATAQFLARLHGNDFVTHMRHRGIDPNYVAQAIGQARDFDELDHLLTDQLPGFRDAPGRIPLHYLLDRDPIRSDVKRGPRTSGIETVRS
jgi:hypothetical protein